MGKSLLLVLVCVACANNVPQDRSTGPDGKINGAKEVALEEGGGLEKGIVTYPGGDRIDWKKITLPEKTRGTLDLQMTYTTPRPNLKVAFDVFDQWRIPVKAAAGSGRNKSITIDNAKGTYFVRVYAPRRGDAGTYKLTATFAPQIDTGIDMSKVAVADPPKLPQVPEADPDCVVAYDKTNAACADKCPPGAPKDHKGCAAPGGPASPPVPPVPPVTDPVPPPQPTKPVIGRVMKQEMQADGSIVVIVGAGSDHGVGKEWKGGSLLRGDTKDIKQRFPGGNITVIRVDKRNTIVKLRVGITSDVLGANSNIVLEP